MQGRTKAIDRRPDPLHATAGALVLCGVAYRLMFSSSVQGFFGNGLADIVFYVALAVCLVSMFRADAPALRVTPAAGAFMLFFVTFMVTAKTSYYPRASVDSLANLAALACLFILVSGAFFSEEDVPRGAAFLAAIAALPAAIALYQYFWDFPAMIKEGLNVPGWVGSVYIDEKTSEDFLTRIKTLRVFATFFTPNVFAGFLVLTLPVTVSLAVAAVRADLSPVMKSITAATTLALAALEAVLLVLTKSKAGIAAACLAAAIFVLLVLRRLIPRKTLVLIVILLAVFAGATAAIGFPRVKQYYYEATASLDARIGYWRATWRLIEADPFTGIGPGNFAEQYVSFKDVGEREVRDPHNAYLLVWAEGGFFALLFFASFWVLVFAGPRDKAAGARASAAPPRLPPGVRETAAVTTVRVKRQYELVSAILAVTAAVALYCAVLGDFEGRDAGLSMAVLCGAGACLVLIVLLGPAARAADPALVRAGLAGGVAGFALHAAVDVDFSDAGAAMVAVFAAALLAPKGKTAVLAAGRRSVRLLALAAAAAIVLFTARVFVPYSQAQFALADAESLFMKGDPVAAAQHARDALELDPSNTAPPMLLGNIYGASLTHGDTDSSHLFVAETFYRKALSLDAAHWGAHERLAALYETALPDYLEKALREYAQLLLLYPNNTSFQIRAAGVLEKAGHYPDALTHYRRALVIDEETEEHGQQLTKDERAQVRRSIERIKAILESQGVENP